MFLPHKYNEAIYCDCVENRFFVEVDLFGIDSVFFSNYLDSFNRNLHCYKKEAQEMCDILLKQPFSGGGTEIQKAINQAIQDIKASPKKFEKVEMMVISDGMDEVRLDKKDLKNIKLHSTIIDGENSGLERISDTYLELNSDEL